jgi:hypothetical protein
VAPGELDRDGARPRRHVQDDVAGARFDARDEEATPARILAEAQERRVAIVRGAERSEELECPPVAVGLGDGHVSILAPMALEHELSAAAEAAGAFLEPDEEISAILPAEPSPGLRVYLCAYGRGEELSWLALRDDGSPLTDRALVRDAVSIVALCELAEENAGGGDPDRLGPLLAANGLVEAKPAADALRRAIADPPRIASLAYLDSVGAAASKLEQALGEPGPSPFAQAMQAGTAAVEELASDVERRYKRPLA